MVVSRVELRVIIVRRVELLRSIVNVLILLCMQLIKQRKIEDEDNTTRFKDIMPWQLFFIMELVFNVDDLIVRLVVRQVVRPVVVKLSV